MKKISVNMGSYEGLIPILFLFAILAIEPNGLTAINWRNISVHNIKVNITSLVNSIRNSRDFSAKCSTSIREMP